MTKKKWQKKRKRNGIAFPFWEYGVLGARTDYLV